MPRKPSKKRIMKRQLTETEIAYLSDDRSVDGNRNYIFWCYRVGLPGFDGDPKPDELWEQYKDDFLPAFIQKHPGKRPLPWWQWSALEPRRRIGGKGQTTWEKYPAALPSFEKGIPSAWEWIDENDPPCFESEAAYLDRHGLLTVSEKKYLAGHPELMEPEKILFNEVSN